MLIVQIDGIEFEPLERALHGLLDVLGPAIQTCRPRTIILATQIEPELGGDHHLSTEGSESLTHKFLVDVGAIDFGRVKESDTALHGGMKKIGHLLLIFGRAVAEAHSHAAKPEGRNLQIAFSKFALLHCSSFDISQRRLYAAIRHCELVAQTSELEVCGFSAQGGPVIPAGIFVTEIIP